MAVHTTLDRFGRVVIPKGTRDHFGLGPGSAVTVIDAEEGILLKPGPAETSLQLKNGILVFAGEITGDVAGAVRRVREERTRRLLPGKRR